jgi:hypothetical protein
VAGEAIEINRHFGGEQNIQDVVVFIAIAMFDAEDVLRTMDNTLGEKETGGEFAVVAGGAHGDADGAAADADLEGFFLGEIVVLLMG